MQSIVSGDMPFAEETVEFFRELFTVNLSLKIKGQDATIYPLPNVTQKNFIGTAFLRSNFMHQVSLDAILNDVLTAISDDIELQGLIVEVLMNKAKDPNESWGPDWIDREKKCVDIYYQHLYKCKVVLSLADYFLTHDIRRIPYVRLEKMLSECADKAEKSMETTTDEESTDDYAEIDFIDSDPDENDPDYWHNHWDEIAKSSRESGVFYNCESLFAVVHAVLSHIAISGIKLRKCKYCGKVFISGNRGRNKYCSEECEKKQRRCERPPPKPDELIKWENRIRVLLANRADFHSGNTKDPGAEAYRAGLDFLKNLRKEVLDGNLSDQEAIEKVKEYHASILIQKPKKDK